MYIKSENLKKIEKLSSQIVAETDDSHVIEILNNIKNLMHSKTVNKELILQELDRVIIAVQK